MLADGPFKSEPPQFRTNSLDVHELAHGVVREG